MRSLRTPAGVAITATASDGTTTNVTEGVQALYDIVIQSMDWGSGFLSYEEAVPIAQLAELCGFKDIEEAKRYLRISELAKATGKSWTGAMYELERVERQS